MMTDLTDSMNLYRECVRHLWNSFFRTTLQRRLGEEWDVADEFTEICSLAFASLVLSPAGKSGSKSRQYDSRPEPLMCLRVAPNSNAGTPILINRSRPASAYWDHPVNAIGAGEAELRFIDLFDFDLLGFRDFSFYRVRVIASEKYPDIVGRDALVQPIYVRVLGVDEDIES